jgi:hypothetical protein
MPSGRDAIESEQLPRHRKAQDLHRPVLADGIALEEADTDRVQRRQLLTRLEHPRAARDTAADRNRPVEADHGVLGELRGQAQLPDPTVCAGLRLRLRDAPNDARVGADRRRECGDLRASDESGGSDHFVHGSAIRRRQTRVGLHTERPLGIVEYELLALERGGDGADELPDRRIAPA